jgi:CheY-like chemotaxis protein
MGCIPKKINVSGRGRGLSMSAKGLRVFVVEDEPMIRILVTDLLGQLGYTTAAEAGDVDQASGARAVGRIRPRHPRR